MPMLGVWSQNSQPKYSIHEVLFPARVKVIYLHKFTSVFYKNVTEMGNFACSEKSKFPLVFANIFSCQLHPQETFLIIKGKVTRLVGKSFPLNFVNYPRRPSLKRGTLK